MDGSAPLSDLDLIEHMPTAVCLYDVRGAILKHNLRAVELWGRSPCLGADGDRLSGAYQLCLLDGEPLAPSGIPVAKVLESGSPIADLEAIVVRENGERVPVLMNVAPIRNAGGALVGALETLHDISAARRPDSLMPRGEHALLDHEQWYKGLLEALPVAVYTTDAEGRITFYNGAAAELWGYRPPLLSLWCGSWRLYTADGQPLAHEDCPMAVTIKEQRPVRGVEAMAERPNGEKFPFAPYPTPLFDGNGKLIGAINMLLDISQHKSASAQQQRLIDELNHRVKNTIATIQSIAAQTFRGRAEPVAQRSFENRLIVLARAHDVLSTENWQGASIEQIVARAVEPFLPASRERCTISGPSLRLAPKMSLSLAMALHELCTNALEHGALSDAGGSVAIRWDLGRDDAGGGRLKLRWSESGGPGVESPTRRGFGARLIERGLAHDLAARITLDFAPGGVVCEIDAPLPDALGGSAEFRTS